MAEHHTHRERTSHGHRHGSIRLGGAADLARLGRPVHRLGRRRFLTELGRNTFAVALLGGAVAACSDSTGDDAVSTPSEPSEPPSDDTGRTTPATDAAADTTVAADTTAADDAASEPAADRPASDDLTWAQVDLGFVSAFVLVRGNRAAVVDTGTDGSADRIGETLAELGVTFDDVAHLVLTHSHGDHVGSLADVLDRAPSAVAYAGAGDIPAISSPIELVAVGDGDDVFGLEVIETPGHTPGSISVLDPGIGLLVAGDALNGNADGSGVAGPNEQFSADMDVANRSVVKLAALEFDAAAFGHGQPVEQGAGALVAALAAEL